MQLRLSKKAKLVLEKGLREEDRDDIKSRYFRQRLWANGLIISLTLSFSGWIVNDYVDNRLSPVSATSALNKQDELQEEQDISYKEGEVITGNNTNASGNSIGKRVISSDNILLVGMDTREGRNGSLGAGSSADVVGTRTDSIMFIHIPKSGGKPSVVSFPRDLGVERQPCQEWNGSGYNDNTISPKSDVKINSIYGLGGPRCLVRTVQSVTHMKVNRFISVDFAGFQDIVNAIGGVTVNVDQPLIDAELGVIADRPGPLDLDGEKALNFVRARKIEGQSRGDYDRIDRQQQFGMAVLDKMTSGGVLSSSSSLDSLSSAIYNAVSGENIDSNFILNMLGSASSFKKTGINSVTIATSGTNDSGNEILDQYTTDQIMSDIATD